MTIKGDLNTGPLTVTGLLKTVTPNATAAQFFNSAESKRITFLVDNPSVNVMSIYYTDLSNFQDINLGSNIAGQGIYIKGSSGNVGLNDISPSFKLDVNGTGQFTGKLTLGGGTDPPYVLYDLETRQSIIDRLKREVPAGKLGGAAMFFNRDTHGMETFVPSEGKFYDLAEPSLPASRPSQKPSRSRTNGITTRNTTNS